MLSRESRCLATTQFVKGEKEKRNQSNFVMKSFLIFICSRRRILPKITLSFRIKSNFNNDQIFISKAVLAHVSLFWPFSQLSGWNLIWNDPLNFKTKCWQAYLSFRCYLCKSSEIIISESLMTTFEMPC